MLPEVKAYFDAMESRDDNIRANRVYDTHPVPAWDPTMSPEEVAAYFEADDKRNAAVREVDRAIKEKQATAYQHLINSEDPLVRFLVTDPEVRRYPEHTNDVLRALPMSREEMEEFGERQDWCREFGRLLRHAERAGVLPEPTPDLADIEPLVRELTTRANGSERRLRTIIKKHLPDIIATAKAKAEQQAQEGAPATV